MRIKINGEWVTVKEGDELDTTDVKAVVSDEDKALLDQAKKLGKEMADEVLKGIDLGDTSKMSKKMERFIESQYGDSSKLKQILNGKDLFGSDELTKEEKILGFFHGLITNNTMALKALAEGVEADGGYLFPNEFLGEILRDLPNLNVMRQYVRIIPMKRDKMDVTSLVDGLNVFWTAENAAKSTTTARFSQQTLTAFKMAAILYSSDELIEDSTEVDLVSLIIQLFAEAIADEEEKVIWTGDGTTQPQGINTASVASTVGTGNAYNDLVSLFYLLPRKYQVNAAFFANNNTAKNFALVKDTTGRPIFTPSVNDGPAQTLLGKPLVISEWVPDRVVYFGDLKKGYFLGDRKRMTAKVSQDTETAFTKDQTAIRVVARIGGRLVLPQAVRKVTSF
jgi:HK97 family phage major capsid protein